MDKSRKYDVEHLQQAIRNPNLSKQKRMAAKRSLHAIRNESDTIRDFRRWIENEHKHGRHDNVQNAYEDAEKYEKYRNPGF